MAIRDIDTLKANMPIGVAGGTSSSDMHDIVDTMADMTSQEALTKTASYTAVATDNRRRIVFNSASAVTRSSGITYYVDGVQVGVHTNPPTENTNLMTNMAVFSDVPPLAGTNTEKKEIEYVRVYSYDAAATPIAHSPGFNGAYYWEGGGIGFFRNSPKHDWTVYNAVTRDGVSIGTLPGAVSTADLLRTWQSA